MSNADSETLVTVSSDGISVEKSFEPDDFPVPAIAFVLRSEREEVVSVRLVDTVPDDVSPEDVGFHPDYGAEFWDVEGETIVFERTFDPSEEYTTVYGLRDENAADAERFMSEPELDSVEPPLERDGDDSGQIVRNVIAGEADTDSDVESDDANVALGSPDELNDSADDEDDRSDEDDSIDEEISLELSDPGDATAEPPAGAEDEAAVEPGAAVVDPADDGNDGGMASALAAEIRAGNVDDDVLATLRDALEVEQTTGSVDARIERLQAQVADFEAYTEALEEFLDENGDAQRLLRDLREELDSTTGRLDAVEAAAEDAAEVAESVDDRLEDRLEAAETRLEERLEVIEAQVDERLETVDSQLEELDDIVEAHVEDELRELWEAIDEAAADAADVADDLETLEADLREFEADLGEVTDERLDELEADLEAFSEDLSDLAEMRDRLASALGGLAQGATDQHDET